MTKIPETLEATLAAGASKMTGAGSAVTIFGWLTSSNFGMWMGILIGVVGVLVNWYFKHQSDKRAHAAHEAFMKKLSLNDGKVFIDLDRNS